MAGRIPQEFISQLLEHADIIDILSQKISLKKAGKEYKACCPFHHEKTPSFTVSPEKQVYHCFGCGASGSSLQFIMEYDHLTFVEAIEELANYYHQDVPREASSNYSHSQPSTSSNYQYKQKLSEVLDQCSQYFQNTLLKSKQAIEYLKNRKLSQEIIKRYQLGYSLDAWNQLNKILPTQEKALIDSGMLIRSDKGRVYDRFRHRIMFPIHNRKGNVIGFGGRSLDNEQQPKYLNSPETPTFDKSKELYGLNQALKLDRHPDYLIIVEGYMDVIALAQAGISSAIASLGTATTSYQIKIALRNCNKLIFCYDGDKAGQKAAWRAAKTSLELMKENLDIRFIFLAEDDDPDSYVQQQGKQAFLQQIEQAKPLDIFIIEHLKQIHDAKTLTGRTAFTQEMEECINLIPQGTYKKLFSQQVNKTTSVEITPENLINKPSHFQKRHFHINMTLVRKLIAFVLQKPQRSLELIQNKDIFSLKHKGMGLLAEMVQLIEKQNIQQQASLLEYYRDKAYFADLHELAYWRSANHENDDEEFHDIVNNFHKEYLNFRKKALFDKLASHPLNDDEATELKAISAELNGTKKNEI